MNRAEATKKIEIKNGLMEILLLAVHEEEIDPWFSGGFFLYYFAFFHAIYCENPNIDYLNIPSSQWCIG